MFKVTSEGVIEFGEPIVLTKDDLEVIALNIGAETGKKVLMKRNGKWVQEEMVDLSKYRVFNADEEMERELKGVD